MRRFAMGDPMSRAALTLIVLVSLPKALIGGELIAHRGGYAFGPENTLANFRHALEHGATTIEMDLRRTADGVIVILHDATVDRTTNGSGPINQMTLEAARALDAGYGTFAGERIPTLEEALVLVESVGGGACLDLKEQGLAAGIRDVTERIGFPEKRLTFICYNPDQLIDCASVFVRPRALYISGGTPRTWSEETYRSVADLGGAGFMFWHGIFTQDDIDYAHSLGFEVHYMGGAPASIHSQLELGLDGFGTDWPEACSRQYRIDAWNRWVADCGTQHDGDSGPSAIPANTLADPAADSDGDGLSNLLEYAMGTDPLLCGPAAALVTGGTEGRTFSPLRFRLRPFKLRHVVVGGLVSDDLANWRAVQATVDPADESVFELTPPDASRQFMRFSVRFFQ